AYDHASFLGRLLDVCDGVRAEAFEHGLRRIEDQLAGAAHAERRLAQPADLLLVAQIDALPPLGGSPLRLGAPALQEVAELRADDLGMLKQPLVGRAHGGAGNRYDADRRAARDDGKG